MHYTTRFKPERVRAQWLAELRNGATVSELSKVHRVARTTIYRWLRRAITESRSSRPHRSPRKLDAATEARIIAVRKETRRGPWAIGQRLKLPASTVYKVLKRAGIARLTMLDPKTPPQRYEWSAPGELVHVDIKHLGLHGIAGPRRRFTRAEARQYLHVMLDDHSRVVFARIYPDEGVESATEFLERGVEWFASLGIRVQRVLTDNGSAYRSARFHDVCELLDLHHRRTRPYRPQTNGKCERWNRTLEHEALPHRFLPSLEAREVVIDNFVHSYNSDRPHTALKGKTPFQRLFKM
jgi:transposase InsO family protein